jgi:Pvc16 N-terminal domain
LGRPEGAIREEIFGNLYLYRVDVSPKARNEPPLRQEQSRLGAFPMALKLHYLFTPRSDDDVANQFMLGKILKFVHETPVLSLPETQQTGTHGDTKQFHLSFEMLTLEQMTMLWTSFGIPHCTSLPMLVDLDVNEDTIPA